MSSSIEGDASTRLGATFLGLGAAGLLATCIFYVLAGPQAALPGGASNSAAAVLATPAATAWMRAAGLAGMPSDVLLAVGAFLLANHEQRRQNFPGFAGWIALGIASALFIIVDAMVAMVLPIAAAQAGAEGAYAGLRALFDVLFAIGTWIAGGGALTIAWHRNSMLFRWPAVGWGMRTAGVIALGASTAHLLGWPGAQLIGPGVAVLALSALGTAAAVLRAR